MRNILALIGLIVVLFVVIGYSRGWYSFSMTPSLDGRKRIELDVDTNKIRHDGSEAAEKTGEFVDSFRNKTPASAGKQ